MGYGEPPDFAKGTKISVFGIPDDIPDVPEEVVVDRARFERLRQAAQAMNACDWCGSPLEPGDLDPIE
jgi:hypothetical protein